MKTGLLLSGLASAALSGSWTETGKHYAMLLDVGINDKSAGYAAALENGLGSFWMKTTNIGENFTTIEQNNGFFEMGCGALDADKSAMSGLVGEVLYTTDGGQSFAMSDSPDAGSQAMTRGRGSSSMYGSAAGNGMHWSTDSGATWQHNEDPMLNLSRYAAMPTSQTWFVSAGSWVETDEKFNPHIKQTKHISSKVAIDHHASGKYKMRLKNQERKRFRGSREVQRRRLQLDGMWASIAKTTDGGKTWTEVFSSSHQFYFNGIDCCSATVCYAVGEGDKESGSTNPGTFVVSTTDGETWNVNQLSMNDYDSLMTAHCISDTEAWIGGGTLESQRNFYGTFFHTTDGGKTWTPSANMNTPVMWMDMSDDGTVGLATGMSLSSTGVTYAFQ